MRQNLLNEFTAALGERTVTVQNLGQSWGNLMIGHGFDHEELCIGSQRFSDGFGGHAPGSFRLTPPLPVKHLRCLVGVDRNAASLAAAQAVPPRFSRLRFHFYGDGRLLHSTAEVTLRDEALPVELDFPEVHELEFRVESDSIHMPHAAWSQIRLIGINGEVFTAGDAVRPWHFQILPLGMRIGEEDFSQWSKSSVCSSTILGEWVEYRLKNCGIELGIRLRQFPESDAMEWRVFLENRNSNASLPIQNFRSLDLSLTNAAYVLLHRAIGAYSSPAVGPAAFSDSFRPITELLSPGTRCEFGPRSGRASSEAMPYWNVFLPERKFGMVFGIGWSGQWHAAVEVEAECCRIQAGNPELDAVLEPGECLELPSILALFYQGDTYWSGQNQLRQLLREKFSPPQVVPPLSNICWGGMTEAMQLARISYLALHRSDLPIELFWIDAGWFGPATKAEAQCDESSGAWASVTGDWRCNPTLLPNGFSEIASAVHAAGMKFMLWLEPERAVAATPAVREHPEWFLAIPGVGNQLLDLGNPEAWQYAFDTLNHWVREAKLDVLRIDCNIDPLDYWQVSDTPERRGIHEIRYISGLYRLWHALCEANSGLWIDNCCSGGRRLDYRLAAYSMPLWSSDSQCHEDVTAETVLEQGAGLAEWMPYFGFGSQNPQGGDTTNFRCAMNAALAVHLHSTENYPPHDTNYPANWLALRLKEYQKFRYYAGGDYYLPESLDWGGTGWIVQQFDRTDEGGVIRIFRRGKSPYSLAVIPLKGLKNECEYEWCDLDSGVCNHATGENLCSSGLEIAMPIPNSCKLIFYQIRTKDSSLES